MLNCYNVPDFQPVYVSTSTKVLSADPSVPVSLLTINGWILMQRKITGSHSVSFRQNWVEYRDGFGSPSGNDNYWLGLDKIYRFQQFGNIRLRVEVMVHLLIYPHFYVSMLFLLYYQKIIKRVIV